MGVPQDRKAGRCRARASGGASPVCTCVKWLPPAQNWTQRLLNGVQQGPCTTYPAEYSRVRLMLNFTANGPKCQKPFPEEPPTEPAEEPDNKASLWQGVALSQNSVPSVTASILSRKLAFPVTDDSQVWRTSSSQKFTNVI